MTTDVIRSKVADWKTRSPRIDGDPDTLFLGTRAADRFAEELFRMSPMDQRHQVTRLDMIAGKMTYQGMKVHLLYGEDDAVRIGRTI